MTDINFLFNVYKTDEEFRDYVNKYCKTYNYTVFSALKHIQVKQYYSYLIEKRSNAVNEL